MNYGVVPMLACLVLGLGTTAALAQAPKTVGVELSTGRRWEGFIDTKSTDEQLVLRFERGGAVLWRPIAWAEISSATLDDRTLTAAELLAAFRPLATSAKSPAERRRLSQLDISPSDFQPDELADRERVTSLPPARVFSMSADAYLANWDQDVEADGLVVELQPSDAFQQLVIASGTLEVELHALQASTFHHRPNSRGRSVQPILRWVQSVTASDYTTRGAVLRIPFQAAHPEFDDSLGWYGLVHMKFSVPGSDVFERSIDGVRIRPWSPLRDYLQMDTGYRFLPHEGTGRGKTSWFTDDQ